MALLGLDPLLAVDQLPGYLTLSTARPANGDIKLDGRISVSGLDSEITGVLRFDDKAMAQAALQVQASAGDLRPLEKTMTGQSGNAVAASLHAALAVHGADLSFTGIDAHVGTAAVKGRLDFDLANRIGVDGDIEADDVDAASATALLLGLPQNAQNAQNAALQSSSGQIGRGAFGAVDGAVKFKLDHVALAPAADGERSERGRAFSRVLRSRSTTSMAALPTAISRAHWYSGRMRLGLA